MNYQLKAFIKTAILLVCAAAFFGCGLTTDIIPPGVIKDATYHDYYLEVEGVSYHYEEYKGDGPVVFLVHGFGSSTYTWRDVIPPLSNQGFHVIALDMKGFGWSDKPLGDDYTPYILMEGVNAFMEAKGLSQVVYAGNSLGGLVGAMLTIEHPDKVKKLILVDAAGEPAPDRPTVIKMARWVHAAEAMKLTAGSWIINWNLTSAVYDKDVVTRERVQAYYERMQTVGAVDAMVSLAQNTDFDGLFSFQRCLLSIGQPTLIIWGEEDTWIPVECAYKYNKDIPGSILKIIPKCGHIPQEEKPEITAKYIGDFARD
ncbi:Pimeloyl-ACP methyl ester carboxylesterase [Desulfatibacillum alkenivorans DSM 16219]|jgi:pimeloyl-ACP methyl ester carboxylesterase|uniref:Pimeloyl-ACP methyl ester carboxylesterase n=1 Tax=Desulfatibacillum alkenivorans DSM 16219 TaxID=1121393 RepID=A0A1M6J1N9_9BACT|nr:alpha/beta hydrolase [Desulfatibacillum alkenivorans]SHJ40562.1 Pimeloyl-ACP methyl ester carboxylesterase [Desulfatibacillum alkenivorans DSM 16219]